MKKINSIFIGILLIAALTVSVFAEFTPLTDLKNDTLSEQVETLRMLGVLSGYPDGTFQPDKTLTRTEFCVMAIRLMGIEEQVGQFTGRTIFPDVAANHWARGYINLAAAGTTKIIAGTPEGKFMPGSPVTYGQAVTVLLRILGYSDGDAGAVWPDGYIALAKELGVSGYLETEPASGKAVTRRQAAQLFYGTLLANRKGGDRFASARGTLTDTVLILGLDGETVSGLDGIRTPERVYSSASGLVPTYMAGCKGKLLLDRDEKVLAFFPEKTVKKTVSVSETNALWFITAEKEKIEVEGDIPVYDGDTATTYSALWMDLPEGSIVTVYYENGKPAQLVCGKNDTETALVVDKTVTAADLTALAGGKTDCPIYKNGRVASGAELSQYDVVIYESGVLQASNRKITGKYENATPNEACPETVTMFSHRFSVIPSAREELSRFSIGEQITLLLTEDGRVAGVRSPKEISCSTIGIVTAGSTNSVTVKVLNGSLELSIPVVNDASDMAGCLVQAYYNGLGNACVSLLQNSVSPGNYYPKQKKLGQWNVSPAVALYERAGVFGLPVSLKTEDVEDIECISTEKIGFIHRNSAGIVDVLVLENALGDCYTYGFLLPGTEYFGSDSNGNSQANRTVAVKNSTAPLGGTPMICGLAITEDVPAGVAPGYEDNSASVTYLTRLGEVKRNHFRTAEDGKIYLDWQGHTYSVPDTVQCYNTRGKSWFASLQEARAFSDNLVVYCDRMGKRVRLVTVS